jgi:HEAT repeat protein
VRQLLSYIDDPDARVRRAAIAVLTESAPAGVGPVLAEATADANGAVRHAAAAGLRELVALLPAGDEELREALRSALASPDPVVRCAILDVLREIRAADGPVFATAAAIAARALATAPRADTAWQARAGAARALATAPRADTAWQARAGAARALAAARPQVAVEPLADAAADPHPEVRKAAVMALASTRAHPAAAAALQAAAADGDADVRAYARQAQSMAGVRE